MVLIQRRSGEHGPGAGQVAPPGKADPDREEVGGQEGTSPDGNSYIVHALDMDTSREDNPSARKIRTMMVIYRS